MNNYIQICILLIMSSLTSRKRFTEGPTVSKDPYIVINGNEEYYGSVYLYQGWKLVEITIYQTDIW